MDGRCGALMALVALAALSVGCAKQADAPDKATDAPEKATTSGAGEATAAAKPSAPAGKSLHDSGPPGDAAKGAAIYTSKCMACHQKDGRGMGGSLAADFVGDKTRLAKPDSVLLKSIAEGVKGKRGVMPPHKGTLSDTEMKDVLAYVRKSFGG